MGDLLPGVALRFTPGYHISPLWDLRAERRSALRQAQGPGNPCGMLAFALKGQNEIAQGNALGKWPNKTLSPERATYTALGTQSIALARLNSPFQGLFDGEWLPGVALRFTPGYPYFAPLGLRSRKKVGPSTGSGTGAPSVASVSLPNWPLSSETGKSLRYAFALKGQNEIAQGNALGKWPNKTLSPERAKGFGILLSRPFRAYLMGDLLPGVALRFTPGYHISPLRGLGINARHSPRKRGIHGY